AAVIDFVGLGHRRRAIAGALPYGEQRLVELAVALAAKPRLLLLDEPGAGMTGSEKAVVSSLIRRVREQGLTVLLVEHDMRMVMGISDTVIVLNGGKVIAEGAPAAIQAHPEAIRAYLGGSPGGGGVARGVGDRGRARRLRPDRGPAGCGHLGGGGRAGLPDRRQRRGQELHPARDLRPLAAVARAHPLRRPRDPGR